MTHEGIANKSGSLTADNLRKSSSVASHRHSVKAPESTPSGVLKRHRQHVESCLSHRSQPMLVGNTLFHGNIIDVVEIDPRGQIERSRCELVMHAVRFRICSSSMLENAPTTFVTSTSRKSSMAPTEYTQK